jgi:hypothetical protein
VISGWVRRDREEEVVDAVCHFGGDYPADRTEPENPQTNIPKRKSTMKTNALINKLQGSAKFQLA